MEPVPRPVAASPAGRLWPLALLVLAGLFAYANSFSGPFVFDDLPAIPENTSIRQFSTALFPPHHGSGMVGRPLVNLSFALNYAIGGHDPFGYHVGNLVIHLLAGLTLYGIVRRTVVRATTDVSPASARAMAAGAALMWMVHPLQTESVTSIVQRTESLMGLFFLQTFYAFIRATENPAARSWSVVAVLACLAGMASKEVMVVAPMLVLLYDRTFVSGSFPAAWRKHGRLHLALAATWILLGWLVIDSGGTRGGTSGFTTGVVTPWHYLLTQCEAVVRYLKLSFWPHPLVIDYGIGIVTTLSEVLPQALLLVVLAGGGALAVWRWPAWGFLAAWFFAILAPSSSVVPLATQTIAEHRMYLPLAAITTAGAISCHTLWRTRSLVVFLVVGAVLVVFTFRRNQDYASDIALWTDTVAKAPFNARAHVALGKALHDAGRREEAFLRFQAALQVDPTVPETHYNLGLELEARQRPAEAEEHYREAIRLFPQHAGARMNLGSLLIGERRLDEALSFSQESVRQLPENAAVHINFGVALQEAQRPGEAITPLQTAVRLAPDDPLAHGSLANAFALTQRFDEAATHYQTALRLNPDYGTAHENFGVLLLNQGKPAEAVPHFESALRLNPTNPMTRTRLEYARQQASRSGTSPRPE